MTEITLHLSTAPSLAHYVDRGPLRAALNSKRSGMSMSMEDPKIAPLRIPSDAILTGIRHGKLMIRSKVSRKEIEWVGEMSC
jgi:hypothetical protein